MEHVILKDFSAGYADDSLKLLIGNILGCKAINLIFKCGFTLKNNSVKMPLLCSTDLFFVRMNPEISSIYCIAKNNFLLLFYSSYLLKSLCNSKDHWFPILNAFIFHFWNKRWKIFKHMKVQILVSWEFPKNLTCVILLVSIFRKSVPYQLKSHSCSSLINV